MAQYSLFVLKVPLNPNQPTNLLHGLISTRVYFRLVMFNVILGFLKINAVNGLVFMCLSFHFMMLCSFYELRNYQLQKVYLSY